MKQRNDRQVEWNATLKVKAVATDAFPDQDLTLSQGGCRSIDCGTWGTSQGDSFAERIAFDIGRLCQLLLHARGEYSSGGDLQVMKGFRDGLYDGDPEQPEQDEQGNEEAQETPV